MLHFSLFGLALIQGNADWITFFRLQAASVHCRMNVVAFCKNTAHYIPHFVVEVLTGDV